MWQDWYFAVAGAIFGSVMIPSVINPKTEMPRASSVPTATMCVGNAIVWGMMGMWWAAGTSAFVAALWTFLAVARPIRSAVGENARGELTMLMAITENEYAVVQQYRAWLVERDRLRASSIIQGALLREMEEDEGGCGGCPSRGSCGS